ncbi:TraB/GumN family protein [Erythrobacter donghaensis]|uniref:TraB/GumN family protein n=1 Tax=Erythrobacter donghaensis TaxID=267135 RepID=UPI00130269FA|nr:TraB/GumN family protein [Erythrobacter donghaensis]
MKLASLLALAAAPLALLAATPALADHHAEPVATTTPATPGLWKVADEDTTIYLFGTFHFLPKDVEWLTPPVAEAMDSADLVVKELGPESEDIANIQAAVVKHGLLAPDQSLSGLLTPEQNAKLAEVVAELEPQLAANGMSPAVLDRLRPWFVFINLTVAKFGQMGFGAESGVESVITERTKDKERIGLETLDQQFGFFASLSNEDQVRLLMTTVEGLDEIETALPAMVENWRMGKVDELAALLNDDMSEANISDLILFDRNAAWAEWIGARMDQPGTVFIAVGAGHLGGPKSVQDFLAQKGITVTRVQ